MYVFHRLGGTISAYKIVPDEIDDIKVIISLAHFPKQIQTLTPGGHFCPGLQILDTMVTLYLHLMCSY